MAKPKFYAVRCGREGPKIYNNWSECEKNVSGWTGARYKSFPTREAAQAFLEFDNAYDIRSSASNLTGAPHPTGVSLSNPWSDIADTQLTHTLPSTVETSLDVPLDIDPFVALDDFIPPPSSPEIDTQEYDSPEPAVRLSKEQEHILHLVERGTNIFFTGSAGTGKSVLLREIINHFGGTISDRLAITASTGIAAVNIGGTTLHSFAGIGLGTEGVESLVQKILQNKNSKKRWRSTQTLIIDEISMVDGALFDKLELIARMVRNNEKPFGGIQLVLSGDFCQLPPVPERRDGVPIPIIFAFEAKSWKRCFDEGLSAERTMHRLTQVFRQRDQAFVDMLNSMRHGQLDAATSSQFYKLSRPITYPDNLEPCELFPLREQVRKANETRLRCLPGQSQPYRAMDIGGHDVRYEPIGLTQAKKLLDKLIAPETIELKVGAQVMLIKTLVQGSLVNGSLGQVIAFRSLEEAARCHTEIAKVDKSKEQMSKRSQIQNQSAVAQATAGPMDKAWPVIRFSNGRTLLVTPVEFEIVNVNGTMEARRDQVPLILAWALSIHKSQGQTLERVKVDLRKVFEKGQAYVALSRATSMEGLQVLNFHPSKVMAHPRVLAWQQQFEKQTEASVSQPKPSTLEPFDEFDQYDEEEAMAMYYAAAV